MAMSYPAAIAASPEATVSMGEIVVINRFACWELGETAKAESDEEE